MDFDTIRSNCINIHQQVFLMNIVALHIGEPLGILRKDELSTNEETRSWDGMRRYAKKLYDDNSIWDKLPEEMNITINVAFKGQIEQWNKEKCRKELLQSYYELGGKNLFNLQNLIK